jgi:cell division protein FtsQ
MGNRTKVKKHSDFVRDKRRTERRKVKKSKPRVSTFYRDIPPMVTRNISMAHPPLHSKSRKEARRLFNIALGNTGAELRVPAMPVVKFGWRAVSGIMVVLLTALLYSLWSSPKFQIQSAEINGIERLSREDILNVLQVIDTPVFTIDPTGLQTRLEEEFSELLEVSVEIDFPSKIIVEIGERNPAIVWEQGGGAALWVDGNGVAFPPRGYAEDLVVIKASQAPPVLSEDEVQSKQLLSSQMVDSILTLSASLPPQTALVYNPKYGLGWVAPQEWKVYFGLAPDDIETRLSIYNAIVEEMDKQDIYPEMINLEYIHAPYYR